MSMEGHSHAQGVCKVGRNRRAFVVYATGSRSLSQEAVPKDVQSKAYENRTQCDPRSLPPLQRCPRFDTSLRRKIVGQDDAIEKVTEIYQMFVAGLNPPGRPVGNLLFLGPTGSGKTRVVEAVAEALFGDPRAIVKIDCAEFQHSHEIAKLIGSPPGYLGHRETHPLLTQEALNQWPTDRLKLSLLLFDEIEKASDALWQLLLGILDKATLTLGDNRRVDLSQCLIILTSNLGAGEMNELLNGHMGFAQPQAVIDGKIDSKMNRTATDAARRKFSPEFMNRIDKIVVFKTLRPEHLEKILDIELGLVDSASCRPTATTSSSSAAPRASSRCCWRREPIPSMGRVTSNVLSRRTWCFRWPTWWRPRRSSSEILSALTSTTKV